MQPNFSTFNKIFIETKNKFIWCTPSKEKEKELENENENENKNKNVTGINWIRNNNQNLISISVGLY